MNHRIIVCHSLNNNTCTGLVISLCLNTTSCYFSFFKYNSFDQSDPPESPQILDIYSVVAL